jgi:hypothetical protein
MVDQPETAQPEVRVRLLAPKATGGCGRRDVLEHQQVHRQRAQVRPVHRRRVHPSRRRRGRRRSAATAPFVQPVFDHDRGDGRDVVDLAAHDPGRDGAPKVLPAPTRMRREHGR